MDPSWQAFVSQDLTGFYRDLLSLGAEGPGAVLSLPARNDPEAWRQGVPLWRLVPPAVDGQAFLDLLSRVTRLCASHFPKLAPELDRARQAISASPDGFQPLIAALLSRQEPDHTFPRDLQPAVGFLVVHTLKVALRGLWKQVTSRCDLSWWRRGFCPLCGGSPSIGFIDREGRVHLYCGLCEARWPFSESCPFCGGGPWEPLPLDSEQAGRGVHACRQCRRYLKIVDARLHDTEVDLFWEDLNTLDLDLAAWRRGLVNGTLSPVQYREGNRPARPGQGQFSG